MWNFLCRYAEDVFEPNENGYYSSSDVLAMIWTDREREHENCPGDDRYCICGALEFNKNLNNRYAVKRWVAEETKREGERAEVNWSMDYGAAKNVQISRLNVIEFHR